MPSRRRMYTKVNVAALLKGIEDARPTARDAVEAAEAAAGSGGRDGGDHGSDGVRSDYGETSSVDDVEFDADVVEGEPPRLDGSLLDMLLNNTLPHRRWEFPNTSMPVDTYCRAARYQTAAELYGKVAQGRHRNKTWKLELTIKERGTCRDGGDVTMDGGVMIPQLHIRVPTIGGATKTAWKEKIQELSGHLLEYVSKSGSGHRLVLYVRSVGDHRKDQRKKGWNVLTCDVCCNNVKSVMASLQESGDGKTHLEVVDLGFVRSQFNQFDAAKRVEDYQPAMADLLANPRHVPCPRPQVALTQDDVEESEPESDGVSDDWDAVPVDPRRRVPLNDMQFKAIQRIGIDKLVLIQGPPGTGKSTTIFNGIKYRLPSGHDNRSKQALVAAVTNQAVAAVLDKLIQADCYTPLKDDNRPLSNTPAGRFSFVLCGNVDRYKDVPNAEEYHVSAITWDMVDARPDVQEAAAGLKAFQEAHASLGTLSNKYSDVLFYKEGKDMTRQWQQYLRAYILNQRNNKPDFQAFADAILRRDGKDTDDDEREPPKCRDWDAFKSLSIAFWAEHLETIRAQHFDEVKRHVIRDSDVVLCTIDSLHTKDLKFNIQDSSRLHSIYIDEASLVPEEAMPILSLYDPTTLVLIGDQYQLRPFSSLDLDLSKNEDKTLARPFFERCIDMGVPFVMLSHNYRNPPELVRILNTMTYHNRLVACKESRGDGAPPAVQWIDHKYNEDKVEGDVSKQNVREVDEVRKLYTRLRKEMPCEETIMIITFYKSQWRLLNDKIDVEEGDRICTVDSCQGTEANAVIISCVRGNAHGEVGFTKHRNRLNVAISRSLDRLVLVGNKATFAFRRQRRRSIGPKTPTWSKLIEAIQNVPQR
eukprot:m.44925 g.44925  ORF g.44925 m.44925 type:complete len:869 (-) comp6593_c0_seq1:85-2691(-)